MPISQTCGFCGSSFDVTHTNEVRLWREWWAGHRCESEPSVTETPIITGTDATVERIGFQMRSLNIELPDKPGWGDE